jgi:enolase
MVKLTDLKAFEIIDSRGNPTVEVIAYSKKHYARASVPSGASKGVHEAFELRDGGKRYGGLGVKKAIININKEIKPKLIGARINKQELIDDFLIKLDNSEDKSKLGANAMLAVSIACFKLYAKTKGLEPFELLGRKLMPTPHFNVINGGLHAGNELSFQEFMIAPKAKTFAEKLRVGAEIYHTLRNMLLKNFGKSSINVGDEGGFAPPFKKVTEALELLVKAIFGSGNDAFIALDVAASSFYNKEKYLVDGQEIKKEKLMDFYEKLITDYPIVSIEDPLHEDDLDGFAALKKRLRIDIIGDDLIATNPFLLSKAIEKKACDGIILKPNQIGTLTESLKVAETATNNKMKVMVSHRSGETCDNFIADLAVGIGCGLIKSGAPCRGERTSKYNRLLRIEEMINP